MDKNSIGKLLKQLSYLQLRKDTLLSFTFNLGGHAVSM